jgi:hypothetical protein
MAKKRKLNFLVLGLVLLAIGATLGFLLATVYHAGDLLNSDDAVKKWTVWGAGGTCISALIATIAVFFTMWSYRSQVQQSKIMLGVEVLMKLNDDFDGQRIRVKRARAAKALKEHTGDGYSDINSVLDFFEGVALFERRGVITKSYRDDARKADSTTWEDIDGLYERVSAFQGDEQARYPTPGEIAEFLNDEIALGDEGGVRSQSHRS